MAECPAFRRLRKDYLQLKKDPLPYVHAEPLPTNILEWHYLLRGPANSLFNGGMYHGKLIFTEDYPFRPPAIYMITPSGRFKTNTRLCLSISDFHPDTWNPTWSVGTIIQAMLSFMLEETYTLGALLCTRKEKLEYAEKSLAFNIKNKILLELFPEICEEMKDAITIKQFQKDMKKYGGLKGSGSESEVERPKSSKKK